MVSFFLFGIKKNNKLLINLTRLVVKLFSELSSNSAAGQCFAEERA